MLYQIIFHSEMPEDEKARTEGHIFRDEKDAYKCAYNYYEEYFEEGCTVFAGAEICDELLSMVDFNRLLITCGFIFLTCKEGFCVYITYAESEVE